MRASARRSPSVFGPLVVGVGAEVYASHHIARLDDLLQAIPPIDVFRNIRCDVGISTGIRVARTKERPTNSPGQTLSGILGTNNIQQVLG